MRTKFTYILLLISFAMAKGQTGIGLPETAGIDKQVREFMSQWNIAGGSVAITKNGKLIYNRGFGFADQAKKRRVSPGDLFRIASVSKPITSIALMKLVEDGKLRLDEPVFGGVLNERYYMDAISDNRIFSITTRHLLEHTAGWMRANTYADYSYCDPPFFPLHVSSLAGEPNPVGDSTLIQFLLRKGLDFDPGTAYAYSNVGYLILGKIIEKVSGLPYSEFVQKQVFAPLGLCDIRLGKNLLVDKHEREVEYIHSSYMESCYGDGATVPSPYGGFNLEAMNAHGGWIATASDLSRLLLAVDGSESFPDILAPETVSLMTTPGEVNPHYAKGWSVNTRGNWWHTGSLDGTAAMVGRTSSGYTFSFLFNSRADNSRPFWNSLDRLPWKCFATLSTAPAGDLSPPLRQVSGLRARANDRGDVQLSWNPGSGDGRILVASEGPAEHPFPADGSEYLANSVFGEGGEVNKGAYVIYDGNGSTVTLMNTDPKKKYYITAFEYRRNGQDGKSIFKPGCN